MLLQGLSKGLLALAASVLLVWLLVGAFEQKAQEPAVTISLPSIDTTQTMVHLPTKRM